MRVQARSDHLAIPGESSFPSILPKIEAGIRFLRPRLLEITVGVLLAVWWLKMFWLYSTSLQWAATLGLTQSF